MKLTVIGFGQCGGRIADEFAKINRKARLFRRIEITPGVFAVNTDVADLSGLTAIPRDFGHRILIGSDRTGGHGVGKVNELGAEIAKRDADKVIDAIRQTRKFHESDALLLVSSSSGGTGSGSLPVIAQVIKERHIGRKVYALVVLPFEHEESTEEKAIYNTATCLKSISSVADAVILVDNQRYVTKDAALLTNLSGINERIVKPFYDLLCAGEETKARYIAAKTLDAGDIIQTLTGWTVIGYGSSQLSLLRALSLKKSSFTTTDAQIHRGVAAMNEAMSDLSLNCAPTDAGKALYLLAAPRGEINVSLVRALGEHLRASVPKAIIRNGDYPRGGRSLGVHVILSALSNVERVKQYYAKTVSGMPELRKRQEEGAVRLRDMDKVGNDVPSLLQEEERYS
ncbi:MAG: tubulin/FtsZ family protein [Chloroflexota bacterium]